MDQWIDTDDWSVGGSGYIPPGPIEGMLSISFNVVNLTKFKLIFQSVDLWIDRQFITKILYGEMFLAPDEYAIIETRYPLTGVKLTAYRDSVFRFELGGKIRFVDAFDKQRERLFGFHCDCRQGGQTEFTPIAFRPPNEEAERNQKNRTPNPMR